MITLDQLSQRYGPKILFDGLCALIHPHDRIGLVGANGAGKTTLLKMIAGLEEADGGEVLKAKYVTIGYLPQDGIAVHGRGLYAEVESAFDNILGLQARIEAATADLQTLPAESEEYAELVELIGELEHQLEHLDARTLRSRIETVLFGLGFEAGDLERDCGEFSGGWQMRIALAKLLLREPNLLLLDEPTNHLDLDSLRWLENWLRQYDGALLLISHDRAFLDALCNRIFALRHRRLEVYTGNYSTFESESAQRSELRAAAMKNQQKELEKVERFIERFRYKSSKAAQVQSRIKALEKVDIIEEEESDEQIAFRFPPPPHSGLRVLQLLEAGQRYGDKQVLRGVNLEIERGERLAIVGPNGAGKSTLVRLLSGQEPPSAGERRLGHQVEVAYFAQHQAEALDPEMEVYDAAAEGATEAARSRLRALLGTFLFRGDDVFKKVKVLSGGEKNRLALAKMLVRPANCLIFDEPTNHLDMRSKAVLQDALKHYGGTLMLVSHDRDFLEPITTRVLEVSGGGVKSFPGTLSDYIAKKEADAARQGAAQASAARAAAVEASASEPANAKERRRLEAEKRQRQAPLRKRLSEAESKIGTLEDEKRRLEAEMADPAFFKAGDASTAKMRRYEALKSELEAWMAEWEQVAAELG